MVDEMVHQVVDSPIGPVTVATTRRGVAAVVLPGRPGEAVVGNLARQWGLAARRAGRVGAERSGVSAVADQLAEYFDGRRQRFDVPLDLRGMTDFRRIVLQQLQQVAYGTTCTYGELAAAVGRPAAARAVGGACAANPVPVVVPCHRVVRSGGDLGGFAAGPDVKAALLTLEARVTLESRMTLESPGRVAVPARR
jgi:methylated-DNA-[protein]-cysteine S-methyltransferase